MSTLTEDIISIQSTDSEEEEIIEDDIENDENEDEDNEKEEENNENENEKENEEEDNENDNDNDNNDNKREEEEDNNKGETSNQRLKTSDVWNFVDKETHKCPSCSKIFGKKTDTSSIRTYLKSHRILLIKEKQTTLDSFINKQPSEFDKK